MSPREYQHPTPDEITLAKVLAALSAVSYTHLTLPTNREV